MQVSVVRGVSKMMTRNASPYSVLSGVVALVLAASGVVQAQDGLTDIEQLGKLVFFDENLSLDSNQSCASCHESETDYTDLFKAVWGAEVCDPSNVGMAYDNIALSIAAYEASPESNAFSSKYDQAFRGNAKLSKQEQRGFALFRGKGKCHRCHTSNGKQALFTDFTYDNLGVPRNPENPFYTQDAEVNPDGFDWIDEGLGLFLESRLDYTEYADANKGKQKVPTLRNVAKGSCEAEPDNPECIVKAYGHNGYFKSAAIVAFLKTLSDGYVP